MKFTPLIILLSLLGLSTVQAVETADGKAGKALDARKNGLLMPGLPAVRQAPIKLTADRKSVV